MFKCQKIQFFTQNWSKLQQREKWIFHSKILKSLSETELDFPLDYFQNIKFQNLNFSSKYFLRLEWQKIKFSNQVWAKARLSDYWIFHPNIFKVRVFEKWFSTLIFPKVRVSYNWIFYLSISKIKSFRLNFSSKYFQILKSQKSICPLKYFQKFE